MTFQYTLRAEATFNFRLAGGASVRKVASADKPFNFLLCKREIRHAIHKQNESSGLSSYGASFAGVKKLRQL